MPERREQVDPALLDVPRQARAGAVSADSVSLVWPTMPALARAWLGIELGRVAGELAQQRAERAAVGLVLQAGQYLLFGGLQPPVEVAEQLAAWRGSNDAASPAVGRVRAPFNEAGLLKIIKQVGHHGPVDAQMLSES